MEILSSRYIISSPGYEQCPAPDRPEYAFIGRSNVGKSSLINLICNNSKLAKISSTPGKTQLINHFEIVSSMGEKAKKLSWYLADLPGYGYAVIAQSSRRRWEQMIEGYIRKRANLVCLFVLIDSRLEPQEIDLEFLERLGNWNAPFVLVFTKSDKNKPAAGERNMKAFLEAMGKKWEAIPPCFITSAVKKTGRKPMLDYIESMNLGFKLL